jgi:predicted DNA binding CopG/RHH family protein
MNKIVFLSLVIFALIALPVANAQFGEPAYQKLTQLRIDESENIQATHVIGFSDKTVMVNLFEGAIIDSITVTNEEGKELEFGISGISNYGSITIFSADKNTIIKYNLENMFTQSDNLLTVNIGYPEPFSIIFSEKTELIFLNNNIIQLGDKKGISINNGGYVNVDYYSEIPKHIEKVKWEEEEFEFEFVTDLDIEEFEFDQKSKSISFKINEKNKFLTVTISEKLLGNSPYVILLDDEKIKYTKSVNKENYVSLSMKPQAVGEIMISNSEYYDELTKITSNDTLPIESESISNDYFMWLVFGGVLIIVAIVVIIIIRKIRK